MNIQYTIEDITHTIQQAIIENCEKQIDRVELDKPLQEYIANSIEFVKIIVDIEDKYEITFANDELDIVNFKNVLEWAEFVEKKLS